LLNAEINKIKARGFSNKKKIGLANGGMPACQVGALAHGLQPITAKLCRF